MTLFDTGIHKKNYEIFYRDFCFFIKFCWQSMRVYHNDALCKYDDNSLHIPTPEELFHENGLITLFSKGKGKEIKHIPIAVLAPSALMISSSAKKNIYRYHIEPEMGRNIDIILNGSSFYIQIGNQKINIYSLFSIYPALKETIVFNKEYNKSEKQKESIKSFELSDWAVLYNVTITKPTEFAEYLSYSTYIDETNQTQIDELFSQNFDDDNLLFEIHSDSNPLAITDHFRELGTLQKEECIEKMDISNNQLLLKDGTTLKFLHIGTSNIQTQKTDEAACDFYCKVEKVDKCLRFYANHKNQHSIKYKPVIDTKGTFWAKIIAKLQFLSENKIFVPEENSLCHKKVLLIGDIVRLHLFRILQSKYKKEQRNNKKQTRKVVSINFHKEILKYLRTSPYLHLAVDESNPCISPRLARRIFVTQSLFGKVSQNNRNARQVHPSHFGRIDPVDSPQGDRIGLNLHLAGTARIIRGSLFAEYQTLTLKASQEAIEIGTTVYKASWQTENENIVIVYPIWQANYSHSLAKIIANATDFQYATMEKTLHYASKEEMIAYMKNSSKEFLWLAKPENIFGLQTLLIPFLTHNDGNRAMMACNMMSQAVPVEDSDENEPLFSGYEKYIKEYWGKEHNVHVPGKNLISAYIPYGAWNYEDAIVITESAANKLATTKIIDLKWQSETFSGVSTIYNATNEFLLSGDLAHWEKYPLQNRSFYLRGFEGIWIVEKVNISYNTVQITVQQNSKEHKLDYVLFEGEQADHLVAKGNPLKNGDLLLSTKLSKFIYEKDKHYKYNSQETKTIKTICCYNNNGTTVVDPKKWFIVNCIVITYSDKTKKQFILANNEYLCNILKEQGQKIADQEIIFTTKKILNGRKYFIPEYLWGKYSYDGQTHILEQKRTLAVGDKLANRHGHKGVVSYIIPQNKAPKTENGQEIDILLNPMGVIGRHNLGQLAEIKQNCLNEKSKMRQIVTLPEYNNHNTEEILVGKQWIMRLDHDATDKLNARSYKGAYSSITQQGAQGRKVNGGQRFGEWEFWSLLAYPKNKNILNEWIYSKSGGELKYYSPLLFEKKQVYPKNNYALYRFVALLMGMGMECKGIDHQKEFSILPKKGGIGKDAFPKGDFQSLLLQPISQENISWSHGEVKVSIYKDRQVEDYPLEEGFFSQNIFGPVEDYPIDPSVNWEQTLKLSMGENVNGIPHLPNISRGWRIGHISLPMPIFNRLFLSQACYILFADSFSIMKDFLYQIISDDYTHFIYKKDTDISRNINKYFEQLHILLQALLLNGKGKSKAILIKDIESKESQIVVCLKDKETIVKFCKDPKQNKLELKSENILLYIIELMKKVLGEKKTCWALFLYNEFPDIRKFYLKNLAVIPPLHRPVFRKDKNTWYGDLNELYSAILKMAQKISTQNNDLEIYMRLSDRVNQLISGKSYSPQVNRKTKVPLKSLAELMNEKEGMVRQELMGRRLDFSGRAVIVPNPFLKTIDHCSLPLQLAFGMTEPLVIPILQKENGWDKYSYDELKKLIVKAISLKIASQHYKEKKTQKKIKSYLDQSLDNGEKLASLVVTVKNILLKNIFFKKVVIINRQPTLHRLGLQSFYIEDIISNGQTIVLPVTCVKGFAADFDGDTVSVYFPLSMNAQEEAQKLLPSQNALHPANKENTYACSQDIALGLWQQQQKFPSFTSNVLEKKEIKQLENYIKEARENVHKAHVSFDLEDLSEYRKFLKVSGKEITPNILKTTHKKIKESVDKVNLQNRSNPINNLLASKAKGKISDISQMIVAIGSLSYESEAKILSTPFVKGHQEQGLSYGEYCTLSQAYRSSIVEKKLGVARAGDLSRKLIHYTHGIFTDNEICKGSIFLIPLHLYSIYYKPEKNEEIKKISSAFYKNDPDIKNILLEIISEREHKNIYCGTGEKMRKATKKDIESFVEKIINSPNIENYEDIKKQEMLFIPSPITCELIKNICPKCLGKWYLPEENTAEFIPIGLIAAQCIGEPGAQLSMYAFHQPGSLQEKPDKKLQHILKTIRHYKNDAYALFSKAMEMYFILRNVGCNIDFRHFEIIVRGFLANDNTWLANSSYLGIENIFKKEENVLKTVGIKELAVIGDIKWEKE